MEITGTMTHNTICTPCFEGKQSWDPIPHKSIVENPRILHQTYLGICGPIPTQSQTAHLYFVTYINRYSHHIVVKLLKSKDEVFGQMKAYIECAETITGERANLFRSDGGGEYGSKEFAAYLTLKGIHHEKMNAYTPQENSVSERMNRTLVESAWAMLKDAGLPNTYWGDAILHAVYILNRVLTWAIHGNIMPYERFTGNKLSIAHLRVFGCKAHVHVPDEKRCKLDAKSLECVHIGYADNKKAFLCLHRSTGRIFESRDVVFSEKDENGPTRISINVSAQSIDETAHPHHQEARDVPPNGPIISELGEIDLGGQTVSEGETSDEESEREVERTLDEQNDLKTSASSHFTPKPGDIDTSQLLQSKTEPKTTHKVQNCSEMQRRSSICQSVVQRGLPVPYLNPIPPPDICRSS